VRSDGAGIVTDHSDPIGRCVVQCTALHAAMTVTVTVDVRLTMLPLEDNALDDYNPYNTWVESEGTDDSGGVRANHGDGG
jgi:hypothetical protein